MGSWHESANSQVMPCTHAESCPLFPRLKGSLEGWRASYCDDEVGWRACERYKWSLKGRTVPLSLLPNGAITGGYRPEVDIEGAEVVGAFVIKAPVATLEAEAAPDAEGASAPAQGWWDRLLRSLGVRR